VHLEINMAYRHELKYMINQGDLTLMRLRLRSFMKHDEHAGVNGMYTIRSLYFDDIYNSAYNEKYMGVLDRQKYRIRIYNQSDEVIHLERKIKWNDDVHKEVASITREEVHEIMSGNFDGLIKSTHPLRHVFYHECRAKIMRPRVIIDYEREPFIMDAGNVRITFDTNLRVGMGRLDIFDDNLVTIPLLEPCQAVLEVKFTEFLPNLIRSILPPKAAEFIAVSKYIMGCDKTINKRLSNY
jgi:hypothetical protein